MANLFESETCGRCGGSGHYSYCQRYGTTCFKCSGRKVVLTKRGSAAQALFTKLASKRHADLQAGDQIWFADGIFGKDRWVTVQAISPDELNQGLIIITCDSVGLHTTPDSIVRVRLSAEQRSALADVCIAYQRSLNKQGKTDKTLAKLAKQVAYA